MTNFSKRTKRASEELAHDEIHGTKPQPIETKGQFGEYADQRLAELTNENEKLKRDLKASQSVAEQLAEFKQSHEPSDAVEFGEWLVKKGYMSERLINSTTDSVRWLKQYSHPDTRIYYSTEQLYKEFKQSKEK